MLGDPSLSLTGAQTRVLAVGASVAASPPVGLSAVGAGSDSVHGRWLIEAANIATGMAGFVELPDGLEAAARRDLQAERAGYDKDETTPDT